MIDARVIDFADDAPAAHHGEVCDVSVAELGDDLDDRIGIIPIILAAIPLVLGGISAAVAATQPGAGGGMPSGAIRTVFTSNPAEEVPRDSGLSVEEVDAFWRARGADAPWAEMLPGQFSPPVAYSRRINDLQWLVAYLASYGLPAYQRAADVPSNVRALWDAARVAGSSLAQAAGVATPASAVPIGTPAAGLLLGGWREAPATWSGASGAQRDADAALAVVGALGGAVANAYAGPAAGAAVQAGVGALRSAIAQGDAGQAAQQAVAGLTRAAFSALASAQQQATPQGQGQGVGVRDPQNRDLVAWLRANAAGRTP